MVAFPLNMWSWELLLWVLTCSGSQRVILGVYRGLETKLAEVQERAGCFKNRSPILKVLEAWGDFMSSILSSPRMQWMCGKYGIGSWTIEDARKKYSFQSYRKFCRKIDEIFGNWGHPLLPPPHTLSSVKYMMCMLCWYVLNCYKQVNIKYICMCT